MMSAETPLLQFDRVSQAFGDVSVIEGLELAVQPGEFLAIVGPSGCGKTTILNLCAGWLAPTAGMVRRHGRSRTVFQHDGLFPWLTVGENVRLGLQHVADHAARLERARNWLGLVDLVGFEGHYPHQLSGGMRQRVNLARALLVDPEMLLMDEPFAALDAQTREVMQGELLRIWEQTRTTVMFVTHQISEAVYLADRVLVFGTRPGRILETVKVEVERPRPLSMKHDERLVGYERRIWSLIQDSAVAAANAGGPLAAG
jgi:NitT/TauT family transport system ATP-binding protein